jgi:hypothetical protein
MMRTLALALLALVLVPSLAQAGGGTKATARITVRNDSAATLGVIVNPPATLNPATATQAEFIAAGGKFLAQGETATFANLKAGNSTVAAFYVDPVLLTAGVVGTRTVTLKNGQTVRLRATGTAAAAPTIAVL